MSETTTAAKVIPTPDQVRAEVEAAMAVLAGMEVGKTVLIEDYPIGGRARGRVEIGAEYRRGQGFRPVRRTTNRHGVWCAPKKGTYRAAVILAVRGPAPGFPDFAGRAELGLDGLYLGRADGETITLAKAPHWTRPRREARAYSVTTTTRVFDANGLSAPTPGETETRTLEADDPALCDAYDAWLDAVRPVIAWALRQFNLAHGLEAAAG